ncbi:uncharacterized protein RAG0_11270 [Rhynchosporium agropyri]|uniref:Hemerythrin-like domain-containing protein n=1 Tax=Rhynchosporium agropyri TaxID=914238 RepID=A0A1E1L3E3_9HELO|nr:uncharacterized protein RAG0_11270 [Rhynchosporium agropyri]
MALAHNVMIRGLNSIYLQAPHIEPTDNSSFISYCKCWVENLDEHHEMEEGVLFPEIEAETGEKGIMDGNIEQHHAFMPGLEAFKAYLSTSSFHPSTFSGTHLNNLIDTFARSLIVHLADEIPSLLELSKFGQSLPLLRLINAEGAKSPLKLSKLGGVPFFAQNLDTEFEEGIWSAWPMPVVVRWLIPRTVGRWNREWWRWASCDESGRLRELVGPESFE